MTVFRSFLACSKTFGHISPRVRGSGDLRSQLGVIGTHQCNDIHTSSVDNSRIKYSRTHKPFVHIKKTNKQADDPITRDNLDFLDEVKKLSYINTRPRLEGEQMVSPLKTELEPWPRGSWQNERTTRCGLIGRKIGVVPGWLKNGTRILLTMVQIEDNHVIKYVPPEDMAKTLQTELRQRPRVYAKSKGTGMGCLIVGALSGDPTKFTKDYCGLFTSSGLAPKKKLCRMPVSEESVIQPGTPLYAGHFQPGQYVDLIGRTMRRGFQGVMKRWGFAGGPSDARGATKFHRRPGCIGAGREITRVLPGKKMPGHMGNKIIKSRGHQIMRINHEHNVIYIRGCACPGEQGEFVQIFDSKISPKRFRESPRFFPTLYEEDYVKLPEDEFTDELHRYDEPSITYT